MEAIEHYGIPDIRKINEINTEARTTKININFIYKLEMINVLSLLSKANNITGGYISLTEEFYFCPFLIDMNKHLIPLYEFIEVLDDAVDYDKIKERLPTLSFSQIAGAISFLRKIAQFNALDKDLDEYLDEEFEQSEEFLSELKKAFADKEVSRVLNFD